MHPSRPHSPGDVAQPARKTPKIEALARAAVEIREHLTRGIIPFWQGRALDVKDGGYRTRFDENGTHTGTPTKYLNTQCRLLWWFSTLARNGIDVSENLARARDGFSFLMQHFWDGEEGGWYWRTQSDGSEPDRGKVVYGQSFAIYALAEYARAGGGARALDLARQTFDLLHVYCADVEHGGYLENLERDWRPSAPGFCAGDRKSLDTHMHLMEAFTVLAEASGAAVHRRRLREVVRLICERMIDPETGCGRNQFDLSWRPLPAIAIRRTWNAERQGEAPAAPLDTTSYGHNTELAWLLRRAVEMEPEELARVRPFLRGLLDHAAAQGVDREFGGIFRDGTARGGAVVMEKEFWQHAEALVGFLDGVELFGEAAYAEAFLNLWDFVRDHFIAPCGEWRVLLDRRGTPLDRAVGNDWKVSYHTGRAMLECTQRLERLLSRSNGGAS